MRGYGQFGTIEGDITCSAGELEHGPNPFRCEAPSNDRLKQALFGGDVSLGY